MLNWLSAKKRYVFVRRKDHFSSHEWRRHEIYSDTPLIAWSYGNDFLFLLPDGKVDGSDEYEWRPDPAA